MLLVNERFSGVPADELIPSLFEDVQWSLEAEDCPKDERVFYEFSHVLTYTPAYSALSASTKKPREKILEFPELKKVHNEAEAVFSIDLNEKVSFLLLSPSIFRLRMTMVITLIWVSFSLLSLMISSRVSSRNLVHDFVTWSRIQ